MSVSPVDFAASALIAIDVQKGFDNPGWGVRNNPEMNVEGQRLLAAWREKQRPIFHVRHDSIEDLSPVRPDGAGNAFCEGFEPLASETLIAKSVTCAFLGTDLDLRLRRLGVPALVIFGIATDMSVSTTARTANNLGYQVAVVGDACSCFPKRDVAGLPIAAETVHSVHLATLDAEFARVVTASQAIAALRGGR